MTQSAPPPSKPSQPLHTPPQFLPRRVTAVSEHPTLPSRVPSGDSCQEPSRGTGAHQGEACQHPRPRWPPRLAADPTTLNDKHPHRAPTPPGGPANRV